MYLKDMNFMEYIDCHSRLKDLHIINRYLSFDSENMWNYTKNIEDINPKLLDMIPKDKYKSMFHW